MVFILAMWPVVETIIAENRGPLEFFPYLFHICVFIRKFEDN